jgi:Spy/CpxP family protein refolding chaperone
MKNLKAIAGILLVFLLGAASGAFLTHMVDRARHESFVKGGAGAREDEIVQRLARKLDLDDQQQVQVRVIVRENLAAIRQVRRQYQPQVQEQLEQGQARISALLRPEQRETFQKMIAERKARRPPDGP